MVVCIVEHQLCFHHTLAIICFEYTFIVFQW